jgi:hypothetical protein
MFADRTITEAETGKLSLIGMFDGVKPNRSILPTAAFFCRIEADPGDYHLRLKVFGCEEESIEAEKGTLLCEVPIDLKIQNRRLHSLSINFEGLPIVGKKLEFCIYDGEAKIHQNSLSIVSPESLSNEN